MRAALALVASAAAVCGVARATPTSFGLANATAADEQAAALRRAALENLPGNDNITYAPTVPLVEFWCE